MNPAQRNPLEQIPGQPSFEHNIDDSAVEPIHTDAVPSMHEQGTLDGGTIVLFDTAMTEHAVTIEADPTPEASTKRFSTAKLLGATTLAVAVLPALSGASLFGRRAERKQKRDKERVKRNPHLTTLEAARTKTAGELLDSISYQGTKSTLERFRSTNRKPALEPKPSVEPNRYKGDVVRTPADEAVKLNRAAKAVNTAKQELKDTEQNFKHIIRDSEGRLLTADQLKDFLTRGHFTKEERRDILLVRGKVEIFEHHIHHNMGILNKRAGRDTHGHGHH